MAQVDDLRYPALLLNLTVDLEWRQEILLSHPIALEEVFISNKNINPSDELPACAPERHIQFVESEKDGKK